MTEDVFNPVEEGIRAMKEIEVEGAAEAYLELFRRYDVDYVFGSSGSE